MIGIILFLILIAISGILLMLQNLNVYNSQNNLTYKQTFLYLDVSALY